MTTFEMLLLALNVLFLIGLVGTYTERRQARKNRTIAEVDALRGNGQYRAAIRVINASRREGAAITPTSALAKIEKGEASDEDTTVFNAALIVLGRLEVLAGGIREGVFDEYTFKRAYFTTIVEVIAGHADFIEAYRIHCQKKKTAGAATALNTVYQDIKWLVTRWQNRPLKESREWWRRFV